MKEGQHLWVKIGASDHVDGPNVWKCQHCHRTVTAKDAPDSAGCKAKRKRPAPAGR